MNYIYDIITNFFEDYIDFYEWEKKDKYTHLKKIPIIKIKDKDYHIIFNNIIKINNELLQKIKNKSDTYNNKTNNYYLLITNSKDIIAIQFNEQGLGIKRSSLLVDEELDIINTIKTIEYKEFNYTIIKRINKNLKTRNEIKNETYLKEQLKKIDTNKDLNKIKYLYYECFNKTETNKDIALKTLINNVNKCQVSKVLNEFFKLSKPINK